MRVLPLAAAGLYMVTGAFSPWASADEAAARAMIGKYTATWEVEAFLLERRVRAELRDLLGSRMKTLVANLSVNGGIEYSGGALTIQGNAPHRGTEEEAVVCVQPWGAFPAVHAAIYSGMTIAVYTREATYDSLPTCIKDWIALVNTQHAARLQQPRNVRVISLD